MLRTPALRALGLTGALCLLSGCTAPPSLGPGDATTSPGDAGATTEGSLPEDAGGGRDGALPRDAEPSPAPTVEALAASLAQEECAWLARCRELELQSYEDEGACRAALGRRWRTHLLTREDLSSASRQAITCQSALRTAQCWEAPRALGRACWPIISGGRMLFEPCETSADCADGFCSSPAPGLECGQCVAWRGLGAPCAEDPSFICGPGAVCESGACLPLAANGLGCDGRCQDFLDCIFDNEGVTCLPPVGAGDRCDPLPGLVRGCPEERALTCVDRTCVGVTVVGDREACDATRWCAAPELVCLDGRCERRAQGPLEAPCAMDLDCLDDAFCSAAGTCALRRPEGQPCDRARQCAVELGCLGAPRRCRAPPTLDCR